MESPPVSRKALISAYVSALPFQPVAIVAAPGGRRCRISNSSAPTNLAPGEKIAQRYYFRPSHIELLLGAAGLTDDAVAALLERTARRMGAPYETEAEIMAAAEAQVTAILARVKASNQAGGMQHVNRSYTRYRQACLEKAEAAVPYAKFIEPFVMTILRQVAMTGRMV